MLQRFARRAVRSTPHAGRVAAVLTACAALALATVPTAREAGAQPLTLTDDRGAMVTLARPPTRIVSLLPSLTETVCVLQACDRLVGVDRYSNWPAGVRALPQLSGIEDVSLEALVRLRPDVVLAARSQRQIERLQALGIPVLALASDTHEDLRRSLSVVARLLGRPSLADAAWEQIEQQLATAAAAVPPGLRGRRVYFEVAATPHAAGRASFIGQTLQRLGLDTIVPPELGPFPQLNPEFIVRAQPDLILAVAREARALPGRPGWSGLRAVQDAQICGFESATWDLLVRPGPRLGEAAAAIVDCLRRLPPVTR